MRYEIHPVPGLAKGFKSFSAALASTPKKGRYAVVEKLRRNSIAIGATYIQDSIPVVSSSLVIPSFTQETKLSAFLQGE